MTHFVIFDYLKVIISRIKQTFEYSPEKKPLIKSYVTGICDNHNGESYSRIILYFIPEFITALVLYSIMYF